MSDTDKYALAMMFVKQYEAAINRVRDLHRNVEEPLNLCNECSDFEEGRYVFYPCNTIEALNNER